MFPNIGNAIKKFPKILKEDEDCREVFPEGCFRVAYKRGHKNLKEIIAPSSFGFASHGDVRQPNHRDDAKNATNGARVTRDVSKKMIEIIVQ